MTTKRNSAWPLLLAVTLLATVQTVSAQTGAGRTSSGQCPPNSEEILVYSPFKPYFAFPMLAGDIQKCWTASDCLFEAAGESRKQQFGATALVMGLIPLTLKDIAWPERRLIHITKELNPIIEMLVLALGLVPCRTGETRKTRRENIEGNLLAKKAWAMRRGMIIMWITVCSLFVLASYAGLVIMEVYSKRSALGCPFPGFVAAWYIIALAPAVIHSFFAKLRRSRDRRRERKRREETNSRSVGYHSSTNAHSVEVSEQGADSTKDSTSAVQGAGEEWPVQMGWGIYYIAGTLIFTSIMAVTVIELVVWVALGFAVTGSSKILAFFLCMVFEETGMEKD